MGLPKEKHHLHIELTAEQYQQLCRQAKLCGLCKRAYIVRLIDGTPIRARPSQEIKDLRTEIHHIGNNINQIARVSNARHFVRSEELAEIHSKLDDIWAKVKEL